MRKAEVHLGEFYLGKIVEKYDGDGNREYCINSPCHTLCPWTTRKTFEEAVNFFIFSVAISARPSIIVS